VSTIVEPQLEAHERPDVLQARAARLRRQARRMQPLVSIACRRRAAELELMAWAIKHGPPSFTPC